MLGEKMDKQNSVTETVLCLNCKKHFTGKFCSECGQSARNKRFSMREIGRILIKDINMEHGLFLLIFGLIIHPGKLIKSYLEGHRISVYSPLKYLLLTSTILAFVNVAFKSLTPFSVAMGNASESQNVNIWMSSYMPLLIIISQPLYAMTTKMLFREFQYNFAEHIILNMFIYGQVNLLSTLLVLIFHRNALFVQFSSIVVPLVFTTFAYSTLSNKHWFWRIIKSFLGSLLNTIFLILLITIILILDLILFKGSLGFVGSQ